MFADSYARARANMVDGQLRPNKVTNPAILNGFQALPREYFVPEAMRGAAYIDEDVPLGGGRYLMEPMVLARLLQAVDLRPSDAALEIGGATGYGASILGRTVRNVVALESDPALARQARGLLSELEIANVSVVEGPLMSGYPQRAPYDIILFGGAVAEIPRAVLDQLGAKGVVLAVLKPAGSFMGQAVMVEQINGSPSKRVLFDAGTPLLPGFAAAPAFSF